MSSCAVLSVFTSSCVIIPGECGVSTDKFEESKNIIHLNI